MHQMLIIVQAYALSKPNNGALQELLQAQPISAAPGHRIVIEPPSTGETSASNAQGPGNLSSGTGYGQGAYGAAMDQDGAAGTPEDALPDDVPLTRTQLQAKVSPLLLDHHCNILAAPEPDTSSPELRLHARSCRDCLNLSLLRCVCPAAGG